MMMIIIVSPSIKGINFIIILECIVYFSSSKGNDYWVWIYVYLFSNWANKYTHFLNNYLLYLPVEAKPPKTRYQLCCSYPSCSDITWSGEYCTVCILYSSQLFIISSGNRIDKVFSSLLMFILLHISFASQLYGIYHLFHHRQQFRWHKLYMYLSCRFSWWMTEIFVWSVQMLRKPSCFVLAIIIVFVEIVLPM